MCRSRLLLMDVTFKPHCNNPLNFRLLLLLASNWCLMGKSQRRMKFDKVLNPLGSSFQWLEETGRHWNKCWFIHALTFWSVCIFRLLRKTVFSYGEHKCLKNFQNTFQYFKDKMSKHYLSIPNPNERTPRHCFVHCWCIYFGLYDLHQVDRHHFYTLYNKTLSKSSNQMTHTHTLSASNLQKYMFFFKKVFILFYSFYSIHNSLFFHPKKTQPHSSENKSIKSWYGSNE